ncbi:MULTISPECIES: TetR/AcrR family transcriptional regulator [unclassified Psychrobacillus]|uniref:TetR/AcrR family transcriptional regulator n=1 Tax=unclassified Psychrobacillus TaxID=2636677 RepID=UPI00146C40E1|nr:MULTISPECIES: TetR/AcrR family transcriptional regulator [unclassified Psychrobacillus]MCM3358199.1 TetR/AcrR family transcriptional regulator [Psychrobacillus sp. MER TA 171]NME07192.1 TetR/AcrR family transcriptional regulator [Psychrobacillus sp. BL-248-WT-3]
MVKKQLIMDKALELFAKQGFEATSVQQITDHCGISKGAFYLSYKSKDELITSLVDCFMKQIISEIDYSVKECSHSDDMLYTFFYTANKAFQENSTFAKIFFKEQTHTVNDDLLKKLTYYDNLLNEIILYMVDKLDLTYEETKYDLLICIKGFMKIYIDLYLFFELPIDIDTLTKSLVEKTKVLAKHSTIPLISTDSAQIMQKVIKENTDKDMQILELINQILLEIEEPIEKETLQILKNHLLTETPSLALIKGLLENIKNHPQCKWVSYLIREQYKL